MFAAAALAAQGARAADAADVAIDRMRLATDRSGILSVEGGGVLPHLGLAGAAWLGYADDPLVLHQLPGGPRVGALVADRVSGAVSVAVGVLDRAQLALEVPVTFHQSRASGPGLLATAPSLDAFGVGSLRLVPKLRLLEAARHGLDLAVLAGVTVPLGADGFIGSEVAVQPELAASRAFGELRLAANVGATLRDRAKLLDEELGSELQGQLGAALGLRGMTRLPLEVGAVLAAAASASRPFDRADETSVELRGFAAADVVPAVRVLAGAGFGLQSGWGTPDWRVFGGLQLALPRRAPPAAVAAAPERPAAPPVAPPAPPPPPPPPPDADGDGVLDAQDRCPEVAGPAENGGCPDQDRDRDGVVDRLDACPDLPGPADAQGCPRKGAARLAGDRIQFEENIYFATGRDVIQRRSYPLLDGIAKVILAHPEVGRIRVEGHTDAQGGAEYNRALSQRRAAAVVKALVQRGVPAERLVAAGFGEDRPVADNATPEGRARNRRVELRLMDASAAAGSAQ